MAIIPATDSGGSSGSIDDTSPDDSPDSTTTTTTTTDTTSDFSEYSPTNDPRQYTDSGDSESGIAGGGAESVDLASPDPNEASDGDNVTVTTTGETTTVDQANALTQAITALREQMSGIGTMDDPDSGGLTGTIVAIGALVLGLAALAGLAGGN